MSVGLHVLFLCFMYSAGHVVTRVRGLYLLKLAFLDLLLWWKKNPRSLKEYHIIHDWDLWQAEPQSRGGWVCFYTKVSVSDHNICKEIIFPSFYLALRKWDNCVFISVNATGIKQRGLISLKQNILEFVLHARKMIYMILSSLTLLLFKE